MKVGICFGGYCPMHRGHLDAIMKAKKQNDKVLLIVCGYDDEERAVNVSLSLKERTNRVKRLFKKDEQIIVRSINDTELGIDESMSESNWDIWLHKVNSYINKLQINCYDNITFYVAEPNYKESIDKLTESNKLGGNRYASVKTILIDKVLPISGTKIRQNPQKYWKYIVPTFRERLVKNILITGTASEGKSTLVRDISTYFNIPFAEEYGRTYMEEKSMQDTDLTSEDFINFMIGQRDDMVKKSRSTENGVFISDTDNIVTLMYADAYAHNAEMPLSVKDFNEKLMPIAKALKDSIQWNKIFLLPPKNKFVDDGSRYMKQSSMEERNKNFERLNHFIDMFGLRDKVEILNGNFEENFNRVKDYINSLYEEH